MLCHHLIVDGHANPDRLGDAPHLASCLKQLAESANMEVVQGPTVIEVPFSQPRADGVFKDTGGATVILGTAVLSTSHISIHTWPQEGFFSFDLYSCKPFDPTIVLTNLLLQLDARDVTVTKLNRPGPQEFNHESRHQIIGHAGQRQEGCSTGSAQA